MKRSLILAILLGAVSAASAAPIYTDDFSVGFPTVTLNSTNDLDWYQNHLSYPSTGFLGARNVQLANYAGAGGTDVLSAAGNGSNLTLAVNGTATGLLQLAYGNNPSSVIDMSGAGSISLFISSYTGSSTIHGYVGGYNGGYDNFAGKSFDIAPGFSGVVTVNLADFTAPAGHTFDQAHMDNLIFVLPLTSQNSSIVIDKMTVNAVPEPASMAALGLGAVALLRRRRK